jgi:hypothetical protein
LQLEEQLSLKPTVAKKLSDKIKVSSALHAMFLYEGLAREPLVVLGLSFSATVMPKVNCPVA